MSMRAIHRQCGRAGIVITASALGFQRYTKAGYKQHIIPLRAPKEAARRACDDAGMRAQLGARGGACAATEEALVAAEVAGDGGSECSSGSVSPACATSHRRRAVYWPTRAARLCVSAGLCI